MNIPVATYRIQFAPHFGFQAAHAIVDYLSDLGISHIYASPIFAARRGSTHGYDVIAPDQLNPELGTRADFEDLQSHLRNHLMGWVQDIVPNHMAFDSQNQMLMDVLESGTASLYHNHFDIEWNHPYESLQGRVLAPFLGKFYGECLESGEIKLGFDQNGLYIEYYDLRLPLRLESYATVLGHNLRSLESALGKEHADYIKFSGVLRAFQSALPSDDRVKRKEQVTLYKKLLWELYAVEGLLREFIDTNLTLFNGTPGDAKSYNLLDALLGDQLYRLSFWKVATEEINYRRFFNINQLISIRVEDEQVFRSTHAFVFRLLWEGKFDGLRVDHVDGLSAPLQYLRRLREGVGDGYLVVEKILHPDEELPPAWPVQGTTGYDFMNHVNGVFCERKNDKLLEKIYTRFTGRMFPYEILVSDKKRMIIGRHMAGDIDRLATMLKVLSAKDRYARDITLYGLRRALVELLAVFPVYRTYIEGPVCGEQDRAYIQEAVRRARESSPALLLELNFIEQFLLLQFHDGLGLEEKDEWVRFVKLFQQLSGPLMAKGFEDTVLYIYNKLVSLNEVGGSPNHFGFSPLEFHHFNKKRGGRWPHAMNATATHDMKRGEDTRLRINVLSELAQEWATRVSFWKKINRTKKSLQGAREIPDTNDEYLLYQTLVGTRPFGETEHTEFVGRIKEYMIKAVREAKVHTAWLKPDEYYEEGFLRFIDQIMVDSSENHFLQDFTLFQRKVGYYGMLNALSQTLLKATCPGVPDYYQGTELWDLSLVDPDNRRPVDFSLRRNYLTGVRDGMSQSREEFISGLFRDYQDGRIKLFVMFVSLGVRARHPDVFESGDYVPLAVRGSHRNHLIAFARHVGSTWVIAVATRRFVSLVPADVCPVGDVWKDTTIELPRAAPSNWTEEFSGKTIFSDSSLRVSEVCSRLPIGLLVGSSSQE
ncbi:MAG: malto-oligosyltrehalose synthase [Ignavibacteria bacterium]|nr:malto-oligosyltrehalose synthase [Ignavibacteria bacterium]